MEVIAAIAVLTSVHVLGGRLRFIKYLPRSGWLSFAGGVSVAYVFLHLLPEVAEGQVAFAETVSQKSGARGDVIWLLALAGLAAFYGVEILSRRSRGQTRGDDAMKPYAFWFSMALYSVYNLLIGYLLHEQAGLGVTNLVLFVIAVGLHFMINDHALREHHKVLYTRVGRWLIAPAAAVGAVLGTVITVHEAILAGATAFICGGVVLNVLKEELPSEAESRFGAFAIGVVAYSALLLALG